MFGMPFVWCWTFAESQSFDLGGEVANIILPEPLDRVPKLLMSGSMRECVGSNGLDEMATVVLHGIDQVQ